MTTSEARSLKTNQDRFNQKMKARHQRGRTFVKKTQASLYRNKTERKVFSEILEKEALEGHISDLSRTYYGSNL